jgi:glutathione S-transferase
LPAVNTLLLLEAGGEQTLSDKRSVSLAMKSLKESLECFEKHLKLRNFVQGYQMTLADIYLAMTLSEVLFMDKKNQAFDIKQRDKTIPNVTRFCTLIFDMISHNPNLAVGQENIKEESKSK